MDVKIFLLMRLSANIAKDNFLESDEGSEPLTLFTPSSLSDFDGKTSKLLYLSILGEVFDVTSGNKHYGPGASYNFFIGKDATRNFVDGNFECKTNCDDATGLSAQELRALENWLKFYKKSYSHVGKLIGRYYDEEGNLTPYGKEIHTLIKKALEDETEEDRLKMRYPGCNMEWDLDRGSHFWCSDQSGGIKRNWIGVPRKLFAPGSKKFRCACIKEEDLKMNNIKEYDNCNPNSAECFEKQ
ncbi:hypothetical protein WA026_022138 [Henosepilachna vigintioctopunctata]|uniref:Cytochrome b5 heme-binding domain-containing protein n=1 Tax=Henosepilachna vigintioctopunctata TaxID=420089 RepID=A0AAW1U030_9CUCU